MLTPLVACTPDLFRLLARPGTFIPTPPSCRHHIAYAYILDFLRKLQWRALSSRFSTSSLPCRFGLQRSSRWPPRGAVPPRVLRFCTRTASAARSILFSRHMCSSRTNLSESELATLNSLRSNSSIVIRPADKGGRWVIMDAQAFTVECDRLLSDTAFYRPLPSPLTDSAPRYQSLFEDLHAAGTINRKEHAFLTPPLTPKPRRFGILPKLHKEVWPSAAAPPGRPIVADVRTESSNAARFIEFFLSPLVRKMASFLLDTRHLIAVLRTTHLRDCSLLCTLDVRSLYTNVPIDEGILRVSRALRRHPDSHRPDTLLLELLRLSLTRNDFSFGDRWFLQTSGVAMGKAFGGSFANLYLQEWETNALAASPRRPTLWRRYQDDIFMVWDHGEPALQQFVSLLNNADPHIQVDLIVHSDSIRYLDLEVYRSEDNTFGHRIGFKETACHRLLPPNSYHAPHVFRGVLYSQLLRFATHSSSSADFFRTSRLVSSHWRSQGISRSSIRNALRRVFSLTNLVPTWGPGFRPCSGRLCTTCEYALPRVTFASESQNLSFPIPFNLSCASTHCIYLIRCSRCNFSYVGQSSNPVRQRISEHLRDIRNSTTTTAVANHFRQDPCSLSSFTFFAFDRAFSTPSRLAKERKWIRTLRTSAPFGLNTEVGTIPDCLNLVTFPALCCERLNSVIRHSCHSTLRVPIRLSFKTDSNLLTLLK